MSTYKQKNKASLGWKIPVGIIGSLIALVVVVWAVLEGAKYAIYSDYYSISEKIDKIPGLNSATPQGISYNEEIDTYFISSYRHDGEPSSIYTTSNGVVREYTLSKNGEPCTTHAGGVSSTGDKVYLCDENEIYVMDRSLFESTTDFDVDVGEGVPTISNASFVYTNEKYLFTGEFTGRGEYHTENWVVNGNGDSTGAICEIYDRETFGESEPLAIIALPEKVQGLAMDSRGGLLLSLSYGLSSSRLQYYLGDDYFYEISDPNDRLKGYEDIPTYGLVTDAPRRNIAAPAMTEDLDYIESEDKFITLTESASSTYVFGKFFFANKFVSLDISKLL
ncbi:MAG: hypothetical protein LUC31_01880 [Coprobacillus sp.]|nr:hypothetical protein [Coprobacillus sp.]